MTAAEHMSTIIVRLHFSDLQKLSTEALGAYIANVPSAELLFVGCAPCQPFSSHRHGADYGRDGRLLSHFARFVKKYQPGQVIIENVPGLAKIGGNSTYRRLRSTLEDCHYLWDDGVLDAKDYGVPQNRRRFILIAMKGGQPTLPARTHGRGLRPFATVRSAISDIPPIGAGEIHRRIPNHRASALTAINLKRLKRPPSNGGGRTDWCDDLALTCHKGGYDGHTDVYGRMAWGSSVTDPNLPLP